MSQLLLICQLTYGPIIRQYFGILVRPIMITITLLMWRHSRADIYASPLQWHISRSWCNRQARGVAICLCVCFYNNGGSSWWSYRDWVHKWSGHGIFTLVGTMEAMLLNGKNILLWIEWEIESSSRVHAMVSRVPSWNKEWTSHTFA